MEAVIDAVRVGACCPECEKVSHLLIDTEGAPLPISFDKGCIHAWKPQPGNNQSLRIVFLHSEFFERAVTLARTHLCE